MNAAREAGDATFVRLIQPKPSPPSLDYHCAKCGKPITNWEARIDSESKLILVARCHGLTAEIRIYLGMGGTLFGG